MSEASVAKPNVDGRELVTCDEHHTRRMAKFCTPVPVYNADHEIISYVFHCKDDQMCSSAMQRAKRQNDSNMNDQQSQSHTSTTNDNEHHLQPVIYSGGSSTLTTKHTQRTKPFTNNSITLDNNTSNNSSNPSKNANTSTYFSVSFTKTTNDNNDVMKNNVNNNVNKMEENIVIEKKNSINKSTKINCGDTIDDDHDDNNDNTQLAENDSSSEHDSSSSAYTDNEKKEDQEVNETKLQMSNNATSEKKDVQRVPSPPPVTVKGPIRYYDLMQRAMTGNINNPNINNNIVGGNNYNYNNYNKGGNRYNCKHMCWLCGLAGHEKPECPNMLCRTCHTPRPSRQMHHICAPTTPSEFIFPPNNLPEEEEDGMAAVRCLFCGEFGHFDCHDPLTTINSFTSSSSAGATNSGMNSITNNDSLCVSNLDKEHIYKTRNEELSCCFCGRRGHTTFNCNEREHVNPDRWIQRMQSVYYNNSNNYSNNNNYSNRNMWREERMQNTSFNNNYNNNNTFDRRNNNFNSSNNFYSSNNNTNTTNNSRLNRPFLSNSNYDKPSTLGVMRSEWRGTEQRKRFRSSEADDNANKRQYNNNNNNNNNYSNNNNEDEREHAQWLRQFRDNTSQQSTSFPTREFSIERSQQRRGNQYHHNNYQNNNNTNGNINYQHRNVNQRNNYNNSNSGNNFGNNRFMRQDYPNQSKYNSNINSGNNNNYQRREGQYQNNAGMQRRRRAKPHEYDSDEDDLY